MNEETAVLNEVKLIPPHCSARTPSGRRCRMAISDPKTGLCFRHAAVRLKENSGDFSEALVCGIKEFHSAVDINHVLGELYRLLAADKISPRRGAVMAYTCSLLLRTVPAINDELNPPDSGPGFILDLPRPKRDWPEGADPEIAKHENWNSYLAARESKRAAPRESNASSTEQSK